MGETTEQPKNIADVLAWENGAVSFSRESVTLATGFTVEIGTVLGKVTASGEYAPLLLTASDGSEVAAAISLVASTEDNQEIMIIKRFSLMKENGLVWPDGISDAEKAIVKEKLETLLIIIR